MTGCPIHNLTTLEHNTGSISNNEYPWGPMHSHSYETIEMPIYLNEGLIRTGDIIRYRRVMTADIENLRQVYMEATIPRQIRTFDHVGLAIVNLDRSVQILHVSDFALSTIGLEQNIRFRVQSHDTVRGLTDHWRINNSRPVGSTRRPPREIFLLANWVMERKANYDIAVSNCEHFSRSLRYRNGFQLSSRKCRHPS